MKTSHNSTNEKTKAKRRSPNAGFEFTWRQMPISDAQIEEWARLLREEWLEKNPSAKSLQPFLRQNHITESVYYRLLKKHPILQEAHEIALAEIGYRLWSNSVDNKTNWAAVKFTLHQYAPNYKQAEEFHANLKKEIESAAKEGMLCLGGVTHEHIDYVDAQMKSKAK